MKLTNKQVDELINNIAGDDVPPLISLLKNRKNVSEFKLAEDLNITVNQIRNMLYRLHKHNLVYFIRKKDKKKGWYIYYWTLNLNNTKQALLNFKRKQLEDFKGRLGREQDGMFYVCPNRCRRYKIESALELDFRCQECGELVRKQDNSRTISNIKARIAELEVEVANAEAFEAKKFAKHGVKKVVRGKKVSVRKAVRKVASTKAKLAAKKAVKKASKRASTKVANKPKKAVKKKPAKKAVKKKAKKPAKKAVKKKAKKPVRKAVKKKPVKKRPVKKAPAKKKSVLKRVISKIKKR